MESTTTKDIIDNNSIINSSNISRPGSPHKLTSIITSLLSQRNKQQILPPGSPVNSNPTILWNRQNFSNEETAANVKDVAPNEFEETKDHDDEAQSLMDPKLPNNNSASAASSALKQMEQMMGRNYSDFMRSLAAKYNQNKDSPNGDTLKNINTSSNTAAASASPFLMPGGHPFPLAAAAAAAAAAGIPVSLPTPTSAVITKDKQDLPVPSYPFPFFRSPNNVMNQVTQTQQALLTMMRNAQQQQKEQQQQQQLKRPNKKSDETPPALDLSSESVHQAPPPTKRIRRGSSDTAPTNTDNNTTSTNNTSSSSVSLCNLVSPCSHEAKEVKTWSIEDVCKFVSSVELCQPFVEHFRAQGIDGSTLILLKEEHLVTTMKMRLGSVLKFKAALAKKMGSCPICLHCVHCHNELTNETTKEAANNSE